MRVLLEELLDGHHLSPTDSLALFRAMLSGALEPTQTAAILAAWRLLGETSDELYAGATALREEALTVPGIADLGGPLASKPLVDNCGTGGDNRHSFNVSTAAAIVAASAGVRLAKHGGRSVSSKCGSADLLAAAGFPLGLSAPAALELLRDHGFTFFFAPNYHPLLAKLAPIRKELGVRTIFNFLGPLANPLRPQVQLVGVGSPKHVLPMAEAMLKLGLTKGLCVHSRDGLDEISPAEPTDAILVANGQLKSFVIDPKLYGINASLDSLSGGDAPYNLLLLNKLLEGQPGGIADTVALNAGAVLWLADEVVSLDDGVLLARDKIRTGASSLFFSSWLKHAKSLAEPQ